MDQAQAGQFLGQMEGCQSQHITNEAASWFCSKPIDPHVGVQSDQHLGVLYSQDQEAVQVCSTRANEDEGQGSGQSILGVEDCDSGDRRVVGAAKRGSRTMGTAAKVRSMEYMEGEGIGVCQGDDARSKRVDEDDCEAGLRCIFNMEAHGAATKEGDGVGTRGCGTLEKPEAV